jgi:hypothetical protein
MATWIIAGTWIIIIIGVALHITYQRQINRAHDWYEHRKRLRLACAAGESSLEWHTMRCTICGNFHPGDDGDCDA